MVPVFQRGGVLKKRHYISMDAREGVGEGLMGAERKKRKA